GRCYELNAETQHIDLMSLKELSLIQQNMVNGSYPFVDFCMSMGSSQTSLLRDDFSFTRLGAEIANAVFRDDANLKLSEELEQKYLQDLTSDWINTHHAVSIIPAPKEGELITPYDILLMHPRGPAAVKSDFSAMAQNFSKRLERLLKWAATRYDITV